MLGSGVVLAIFLGVGVFAFTTKQEATREAPREAMVRIQAEGVRMPPGVGQIVVEPAAKR